VRTYLRRLSTAARWGLFVACPVSACLFLVIQVGMRA